MISFCAVSRHQPFAILEIRHQVRRRVLEHVRLRPGRVAIVNQPPDPAPAGVLVEAISLDHRAQVGVRPRPVPLLDDTAVHVHDVKATVRPGGHVDRTKIRIRRADEFRLVVRIGKRRDAVHHRHLRAADQAAHRLAHQHIAAQVVRQPVSPEDFLAAAPRKVIERQFLRTETDRPSLVIRDRNQGPDSEKIRIELPGSVDAPVEPRGTWKW